MNAPDYHDISTSIAEIIAKTSKPLAEAQKMALVGSVSIWLLQRDQRIEKLEEQNRKMRHALTLITDEVGPAARRMARECLSIVGPTSGKPADEVKP